MFNPQRIEIPSSTLERPEVVFFDVDFIPIVDLMDDEFGVVALDEPVRTFPCEEAYLKGIKLTREQFLQRFPRLATHFVRQLSP